MSLLLVMFKIIEIRLKLVISFAVGSIGDMMVKVVSLLLVMFKIIEIRLKFDGKGCESFAGYV